jgi:hypothetical protein
LPGPMPTEGRQNGRTRVAPPVRTHSRNVRATKTRYV